MNSSRSEFSQEPESKSFFPSESVVESMPKFTESAEKNGQQRTATCNILIFLTAYNEEETIETVLDDLFGVKEKLERETGHNVDILVIDDGSTDQTLQYVRERDVFVIPHPKNLGPGAATQTGYKFAVRNGYNVTVRMDADGQHPPQKVPKLLEPVLDNRADIVIGSRFKSADGYKPALLRRTGISFYSKIISILTGESITDITSGFRATGIDVGKKHAQNLPHGIVAIDRGIREGLSGFRIDEVPVEMEQRDHGDSYLSVRRLAVYPLVSVYSMINALWKTSR